MEDYVYVLDHLPNGRADLPPHRREPVAYGIGENQFTLLELTPKEGLTLNIGERVYIGKDTELRDKIAKVKGRVNYDQLTSTAHGELPYILQDIITTQEARFVKFYNEAPPISTRFHALELLPGLGKKSMTMVLEERKKKPFDNFEDIQERAHAVHHPEKLIAERILLELQDPTQKYHIFARPPVVEEARGPRGPRGYGPSR